MKKFIILFLFLPFLSFAQEGRIGKVFEAVNAEIARSGEFQQFQIFNQQTRSSSNDYAESVNDGVILEMDQEMINNLRRQSPARMSLTLPFRSTGETVALDLIQVEVFSPSLTAVTDTGIDLANTVDFGVHYRGVIAGNQNSLVSISIFETQVIGFISNSEGNFTLGRLSDSSSDHILYKDTDLRQAQSFECFTEDDNEGYTAEQLSNPGNRDPGDVIEIYIEAGSTVAGSFGGDLPNTVAFLTGVFAQCYALYANDGISARTSSMFVWTELDPYTGTNTTTKLNQFKANLPQNGFDGDLGHLVEVQNIGGQAAGFSGLCAANTDDSLCVSGFLGTSFNTIPTYSFNVYLIAHEMGHLMGSRHTHACVWNGDNTAIDGCAGFTEGGCPLPGLPAGGGTIMSYCNNTGVGVNFNEGFGPQPTAVILNNIDAVGNCLVPIGTLVPPTAVCTNYTAVLDTNGTVTIVPADVDGGSYDDLGITNYTIDIDTFDCDDLGDNDVLLTVTDGDGLSHTCIAIVKVVDETDPVVTDCPADFTEVIPQGTQYELLDYTGTVTATDNCPSVTISQDPDPGTLLDEGVYTITLTGEDEDGNEGSCSFELTVEFILANYDASLLSSLALYPNPAFEYVQLSNPQNLELERIAIYDITGRLIQQEDLTDMGTEVSIDVSALAASTYFVIISNDESQVAKQLIKK
ncbi:MAG: T9SS type A sorting domain-containing protein [Bacteroidia bacterium]|nr:T9SS type A sorting domain-containing protein [Bacteroidia bacterium]NNF31729.1 T9SS type A sorting domain-containing protein [Flavobacteriaceae bacterium]NNK55243.1 T9SS type A sorting domain-containing protein [Flavobacteriaceae bacterium]NNM10238.1 T9SS type A sorting domain-containing protein [Flavobacteriaceae bacterium]